MMNFRIEKRIGVQATSDRIWDLIIDLPSWNRWNPVETDIEGAIAFGGALTLTETIPGLPERRYQAAVTQWQPWAQLVLHEKRGWQFSVVRYFEIEELEPGSCIVANGAIFRGLRGEGFHDKHRKAIRAAYEQIAESLRLAAEG